MDPGEPGPRTLNRGPLVLGYNAPGLGAGDFTQEACRKEVAPWAAPTHSPLMAYELGVGPLPAEIRRIADEQIGGAVAQLMGETDDSIDDAVHDARKRFKKTRALLRLVRDEIGDEVYRCENAFFRDAGRVLSPLRDGQVLVATLDGLSERFPGALGNGVIDNLRKALVERYEAVRQDLIGDQQVQREVAHLIGRARQRVGTWPLERDGFEMLAGGLRRQYRRGREAFAVVYQQPSGEGFHEWRKRVKDLWYHLRILRPMWPPVLDGLAAEADVLADELGLEHDLGVLRQALLDDTDLRAAVQDLEVLLVLIEGRRARLRETAWPRGRRLYVDRPKVFAQRLGAYWDAWRYDSGHGAPGPLSP